MVIGIYGLKNFALFLVKFKVARLDFFRANTFQF